MKTTNFFLMACVLILGGIFRSQGQSNVILGPNNTSGGVGNVSIGFQFNLFTDPNANYNTFLGSYAGVTNVSGQGNTFIGHASGNLTNGIPSFNTAIGLGALQGIGGDRNIGIGVNNGSGVLGNDNILLGNSSGMGLINGSNNLFLGNSIAVPATTSGTIILADGLGVQRFFAHNNGCVGIGLSNNQIPQNRLEINAAHNAPGKVANTAGLRFNGFSNTSNTFANPLKKVLSVDGDGNVILVNDSEGSGSTDDWHLKGNANTNPSLIRLATPGSSDFLGTTDNKDLVFRRNSIRSGLIQSTVLNSDGEATTDANTSLGFDSLTDLSTGTLNTAIGANSLRKNTTGISNTALGVCSLQNIASGNYNTAIGVNALRKNTLNSHNVAVGSNALHNSLGTGNVGVGSSALGSLGSGGATGDRNVALGRSAGTNMKGGFGNVFIGNNSGPTATGSMLNNTLYIDSPSLTGNDTPLIFGNFLNQDLTFNVAAKQESRVRINSWATDPLLNSNSGLNFPDLNSNSPAPANTTNKFLTVNTDGDVVLETMQPSSATCNIYSCDGILSGNRTVDMGDKKMIFDTQENGRIYIGDTNATNPFTVGTGNNFPAVAIPDSNYRLLVEGGILTEKVKIALRSSADWADYVFAQDYKLMPLNEVESYIKENQHLPGIASAEDLVKNGLDISEIQAKQMGKIEELTLYVIEQNKEIQELKAQVKALLERK